MSAYPTPVLLLACSGGCVQFLMERAMVVGWATAVLTLALAGCLAWKAVRDRKFLQLSGLAFVALFHPGWWLSAFSGDCGFTRIAGAGFFAGLLPAILAGRRVLGEESTPARRLLSMGAGAAVGGLVFVSVEALSFSFRSSEWQKCISRVEGLRADSPYSTGPASPPERGVEMEGPRPLPIPGCQEKTSCLCPWKGEQNLAAWEQIEPPTSQESLLCANSFPCSWFVEPATQVVHAYHSRPDDRSDPVPFPWERRGTRHAIAVENGWLVASNAGEWGASVEWISPDGGTHHRVSEAHVNAFARIGAKVFAATGLDHLEPGRGQVLEISPTDGGRWIVQAVASLDESAHAMAPEAPNNLLVTTRTQLIRVFADGGSTVLHSNPNWWAVHPSNVVVDRTGTIFLGMGFAVARLEPTDGGYTESWLVPSGCSRTKRSEFDCFCVGDAGTP